MKPLGVERLKGIPLNKRASIEVVDALSADEEGWRMYVVDSQP
jgi:hypothetical protein